MMAEWWFECRYALRHPRVRIALKAVVGGLVVLAVALAYWWPAWHRTQSLEQAIADYRHLAGEKRHSAELSVTAKRAAAQIGAVEARLDQQAIQSALVKHLGQLANRRALHVVSSNYDESRSQESVRPMTHELVVQGSYESLRGFLADIPSLPTLTVVEECSISRLANGRIKATLQMRTWRRAEGRAGGAS